MRHARLPSSNLITEAAFDKCAATADEYRDRIVFVPFKDPEAGSLMDVIASREHPLAMYLFTADKRWAWKMMRTHQYGGDCINEVCVHLMVKGVPFGGTGHSGMGAYHGEWGFREFTHPCTVLMGSTHFNLPLREHPYSGRAGKLKLRLLRLFER